MDVVIAEGEGFAEAAALDVDATDVDAVDGDEKAGGHG